ncbi:small subunit ribosomal protein S20 [Parabacteroides sp. PFB2-12]|uniref:30S ribosomal protein S20 n=1 Tax=unclassified Parabacteroides TaxID=2649774 RepID=UPI00247628DE|nr:MULTISPECIES: 30S ribosomal protein S20 [unclassified Parabacteroides]MDH6341817.1 small subunit ribosomal protein S20 [Parabacteroides sp. PM6-13]MDH6391644.1 small subunit ribosomal protein S20 [Parabacteroides sp. PFB2-12]
MANHKSSLKRIRQTNTRRLHNRYYAKTARNAMRKLRALEDKTEAQALYPKVCSMLDRLAKKNIIHKNKAGNLKSKLSKHIAKLA